MHPHLVRIAGALLMAFLASLTTAGPLKSQGLVTRDLYRLRSVAQVAIAPNNHRVAYSVTMSDRPGRPYSQTWIMDLSTKNSLRLGGDKDATSDPVWSPDGEWIAYTGGEGEKAGLWVAHADGSRAAFLAPIISSNFPLPGQGQDITWAPDSRRLAYISAVPGPETAAANGDPMVITRYLYKPTFKEGLTHFNDNRRLHIFVVDVATREVTQLTHGITDEHSIDWSPDGAEILFASNHEPNSDEFFKYDLFAIKPADGSVRRLIASEGCAYAPRWSPDGKHIAYAGTRRGLTDRETTMEDTHVWVMDADGSHRREIGAAIDNRQGQPQWSPDGNSVYFALETHGSVHLIGQNISDPHDALGEVANDLGTVGSFSPGKNGLLAYAFASQRDLAELYLKIGTAPAQKLTDLNTGILGSKPIAEAAPFTFISNDNRFEVEAFLTKPPGLTEGLPDMALAPKHPMIVSLHGGPHAQSGPAFVPKNQIYAALGWAVLQVNYRGSTGYGQRFADAVFGDQDGNEAQDVLYAVSAAVRRYPWIDRERLGIEGTSYGGQLSMWLVTQTNEFKAAVPIRGIANLVSYNYMTYYNQYEEMEFGQFLHQDSLMDFAWQRSALRYVAHVHTPTLLMHGENDADVPIAESEQFFIALKDIGVDTVLVRYPREGHGLDETQHLADSIDRSIAWYKKHFPHPGAEGITNIQP